MFALSKYICSNAPLMKARYLTTQSGMRGVLDFFFGPQSDRNKNTLITPYHWPDLDGVASAYSLQQLLREKGYRDACAMISQTPQIEPRWAMQQLGVYLPEIRFERGNQQIVCVDVSDPSDLPADLPLDKVNVVIDHHPISNLKAMPYAINWTENVGAAATLIAKLYHELSVYPETNVAKLLHGAIMSNTISCHTRNTTSMDIEMAQWTKTIGNINDRFINEMFQAKSDLSQVQLYDHIHEDLSSKTTKINDRHVALAQLEITGVKDLLESRRQELIEEALPRLKAERKADSIILTAIDLTEFRTYFLFTDPDMKTVLHRRLNLQDGPCYSIINSVLTRKDIQSLFSIGCY